MEFFHVKKSITELNMHDIEREFFCFLFLNYDIVCEGGDLESILGKVKHNLAKTTNDLVQN